MLESVMCNSRRKASRIEQALKRERRSCVVEHVVDEHCNITWMVFYNPKGSIFKPEPLAKQLDEIWQMNQW